MATLDYYNFGVLRNDGNWSAFCLYNDATKGDRFLCQVETVTNKNDVIQLIETRATNVKARLELKGFQNVVLGTTQSSQNNYVYKPITFDAFPTSGGEGGGCDGDITIPDYTQILTSINTNLSNLNTNISSKDNQSDIVNCLNNIFCYQLQTGANISAFKDNLQYQTANDNPKRNLTLCNMLFHIYAMLLNDTSNKNSLDSSINKRTLLDISKKISYSTPSQNNDNNSIFRILRIIALALCKDSSVNLSNDSSIISSAALKDISDKLANSNDIHTISQAIDLISTAIAQAPTTDVSGLTSAVQNLKLEQNNLIQVEGDIDYRIKYDKDKE